MDTHAAKAKPVGFSPAANMVILTVSQVDPEIKGGLIVEIGDRTIDLSVSSRIAKLNKLLTDAL